MKSFDVLEGVSEEEFIENYIKTNTPVVVKDIHFDPTNWTPEKLKSILGDLSVLVYDTLFSLQEVSKLSEYIDNNFGLDGGYRAKVPYVRWYNQLKNVEYAWGNEAFDRLSKYWTRPSFLPQKNLLVPMTSENETVDPTTDSFPYRGILIAAKGARTRLHTDPFCSDAVVAQFSGVKEAIMYHPSRVEELKIQEKDNTSYGGFIDVREKGLGLDKLSIEPDYHGYLEPGSLLYVPHGWVHDVLVVEDSISITWNFIHEKGALEFIDYLMSGPEDDSEFEVLKYFYSLAGENFDSSTEIIKRYNKKFAEIETMLS